jgi:hypothetical protein
MNQMAGCRRAAMGARRRANASCAHFPARSQPPVPDLGRHDAALLLAENSTPRAWAPRTLAAPLPPAPTAPGADRGYSRELSIWRLPVRRQCGWPPAEAAMT